MKKTIISTMMIAALLFSQGLRAETTSPLLVEEQVEAIEALQMEELTSTATTEDVAITQTLQETASETAMQAEDAQAVDTSKMVHEQKKKSSKKNWGNVLLAAGAVAVAVIVLILVSNHSGSKEKNNDTSIST